jgi:DNA repair protein RadC
MKNQNTIKQRWQHPGGKLLELGPVNCFEKELLAILIGTGYQGISALDIAEELLQEHISLYGLMGKNLAEIAEIKGLKATKSARIAAAYEIARRLHIRLQRDNK